MISELIRPFLDLTVWRNLNFSFVSFHECVVGEITKGTLTANININYIDKTDMEQTIFFFRINVFWRISFLVAWQCLILFTCSVVPVGPPRRNTSIVIPRSHQFTLTEAEIEIGAGFFFGTHYGTFHQAACTMGK